MIRIDIIERRKGFGESYSLHRRAELRADSFEEARRKVQAYLRSLPGVCYNLQADRILTKKVDDVNAHVGHGFTGTERVDGRNYSLKAYVYYYNTSDCTPLNPRNGAACGD